MSDGYFDSFYELVANVVSWINEWLVALLPYPAPPQDSIAIFMPDDETHTGIWSIRNGSTSVKEYRGNVEDAVKAFARNVPPNAVHAVFVSITSAVHPTLVKRVVRTLKAVGYANIRTLGTDAYTVSASIDAANVQCDVGGSFGVLNDLRGFSIFQKTDNGFKQVMPVFPLKRSKDPALKHIVVCPVTGETVESQKARYRSLYPEKELYFPSIDSHQLIVNHAWRSANGTAFVDETVSMVIVFVANGALVPLFFDNEALPATKSFQLDIVDAEELDVYVIYINTNEWDVSLAFLDNFKFEKFEEFRFLTKKERILNITITVNLQHLPVIEVTTVDPVKPSLSPSQKPYVAICQSDANQNQPTFHYEVISSCDATKSRSFSDIDDLIADLRATVPSEIVGFIRYRNTALSPEVVKCYRKLRGYAKQYFEDCDILPATVLYGYNVTVAEGECVLLWMSKDFCIILKRSGTAFKFLGRFNPDKNPEVIIRLQKYEVKAVVYCDHLKLGFIERFGGQNVIVGNAGAAIRRFTDFYLNELLGRGNFGRFTIPTYINLVIDVSWNDTMISFNIGGDLEVSYEWKTEVDLGSAGKLKVATNYWKSESNEESTVDVKLNDSPSGYAVLTFCIEDLFDVKVTCAPLPPGRTPRPLSFCLLIEKTATGIRRTLYSRDSNRTIVENFSNIFAALDSFKLAPHSAIVFNAIGSTVAEREKWQKVANEHYFPALKFLNADLLTLHSTLFDVDVELADKKTVLVSDMTAIEKSGQKAPVTYVLQSHQKKLKLNKITKAKIGKVYDSLESVEHVYVAVEGSSKPPILPAHLNSVFLQASAEKVSKYLFSKVDTDPEAEPVVADIAGITFIAEWRGTKQVFHTEFDTIPFSRTVSVHISEATSLRIKTAYFNGKKRDLLEEISFDTLLDRVVVLNLAVDAMLVPSVKHVRSDPLPATVFEFTTDNRVIVRSNTIEEIEYAAYVSFVDHDNVIVGEGALVHQQLHPNRVVYDIYRMLSSDFDPDHPDPSWAFKTTRGNGDDVIVHMGDACTTLIVCFGLIVSAIKKNIEERSSKNLTDIGINLPAGSFVSEDAKSAIGKMIAIELVVFN